MTNQVNQAFEYRRGLEGYVFSDGTPDNADYGITHDWFQYGYQAATQASDSEINSLKQRVEELEASNNQLRVILASIGDKKTGSKDKWAWQLAREALSSTPTQSLAEHDNE